MKSTRTHPPAAGAPEVGSALACLSLRHQAPPTAPKVAQLTRDDPPHADLPFFWRLPIVEVRTGLKKSAIYAGMKDGTFPKAIKISSRCVAWNSRDVLDWIEARIAAAEGAAA